MDGAALYDPIAVLMEEHQAFLRRLQLFRIESRRLADAPSIGPRDPELVRAFAEFLLRDVDELHGRKEERALFPALAGHLGGEGGPIGVMLEEHDLLRGMHSSLVREAVRLEGDREHREAARSVAATAGEVDGLLSGHIDKEDRILFPMARELLSRPEMLEVARRCQEIEATAFRAPPGSV